MEWIEQLQHDLGTPVVDFAINNWVLLLVMAALGVWWLLRGVVGGNPVAEGDIGGDAAGGADSGSGDGGGGD